MSRQSPYRRNLPMSSKDILVHYIVLHYSFPKNKCINVQVWITHIQINCTWILPGFSSQHFFRSRECDVQFLLFSTNLVLTTASVFPISPLIFIFTDEMSDEIWDFKNGQQFPDRFLNGQESWPKWTRDHWDKLHFNLRSIESINESIFIDWIDDSKHIITLFSSIFAISVRLENCLEYNIKLDI